MRISVDNRTAYTGINFLPTYIHRTEHKTLDGYHKTIFYRTIAAHIIVYHRAPRTLVISISLSQKTPGYGPGKTISKVVYKPVMHRGQFDRFTDDLRAFCHYQVKKQIKRLIQSLTAEEWQRMREAEKELSGLTLNKNGTAAREASGRQWPYYGDHIEDR